MADTVLFDSLLNTTSGMTAVVNNTKHDDDTISVVGVDWFTYAGKATSTIYVSGNNWIGFGQSAEQLKICRRDGAVYYIYRQEGTLDSGKKFLKIRVEGYSHYSTSYQSTTGLKYEIFLIEGQILFINVIQVPANSNYIGTSSVYDGTATKSLTISTPSAVPVYVLIKNAGNTQEITYEKYSDVAITGISVMTLPTKTIYYQNELFDNTGMVISANLSDGSINEITDYELSGFDSTTAGTKTITVMSGKFVTTFEVTISEESLTGIVITTLPSKTEYHINGIFETDGIVISITTSDGKTIFIAPDQLEYSGFDSSSPGNKTITVTYNRFTTEFAVTIMTPASISYDYAYGTAYFIGDTSNTGVNFISVTYRDGITDKNIESGYTVSQVDTSTVGQKTSVIDYFGVTAEIPVIVLDSYSAQIGTPNAEDVTATLDLSTGILNIFGIGKFNPVQSVPNTPNSIGDHVKVLNIGEGITNIPNQMFPTFGLINLEQISLSDTLTEIGYANFNSLKATEIVFPQSLQKIGSSCFNNCINLQKITFHEGLESIGASSFNACSLIKNLILPSTLKDMQFSFQGSKLENLEIGGEGVLFASNGRTFINNIYAKNTIIRGGTISYQAFGRKDIETLTLNGDVKWEQQYQFNSCAKLKNVIVGDGVTEIPQGCFASCSALEDILIPESVASIGISCFLGCKALETITLPKGLKKIPSSCFSGCGFETFTIPDDSEIEEIENAIFQGCTNLKNVYIGKNVKVIGESAFYGTDSVTIQINQTKDSISGSPWYATNATVKWLSNVEKIEITALPSKLKYKKDELFDSSGLIVTAFYKDGTSEEILDYSISSPDMSGIGNKTITVTYEKQTATFEILVIDISKIEVTTMPSQIEYLVGTESLDTTGLTISAVYTDDSKETITGYSLSNFDSSEPGEKTITVTYKTFTTTFTITVVTKTAGIRIVCYPDKTYYEIGSELDISGLIVAKYREDGSETEITDYSVSGFDSSKTGTSTTQVMYTESISSTESKTFSTSFQVNITKDGKDPFSKDKSEQINVTIHWINGEFEDLTNKHIQNSTLALQESICSENYFVFGGCVSNQITFQAEHEQFCGTDEDSYPRGKIEAYLECAGTEVKIFTGEIESAERKTGSMTRNFIAYDYLYKSQNIDITWWYKNMTADKNQLLTQKQFRDSLFSYLGIEQVETTLPYDNAYVPNMQNANEMKVANILKDLCLQNNRFGRMTRDGKFEYLKLNYNSYRYGTSNSGKAIYKYYNNAEIHLDTFKSFWAKEGRVWFPYTMLADPNPSRAYGFTQGGLTAQEAYENNVYYNRNSFFVGNEDWLNYVWDADEYGGVTRSEPIMDICYGTFVDVSAGKFYRAQAYTVEVEGNPLNLPGQSVELHYVEYLSDGTELEWNVHSYIMSRTLKLGNSKLIDTYSAKNAPYNGNTRQLGNNTPEISATVNKTRAEMPVISYSEFSDGTDITVLTEDGTTVKKDTLRCMKRIKKADLDALFASGLDRTDTIYWSYEEKEEE